MIYEEKVIAISKLEIIFHPFMVTITTPAQNHPKVEFQTKNRKNEAYPQHQLAFVQMPLDMAPLHTEVKHFHEAALEFR